MAHVGYEPIPTEEGTTPSPVYHSRSRVYAGVTLLAIVAAAAVTIHVREDGAYGPQHDHTEFTAFTSSCLQPSKGPVVNGYDVVSESIVNHLFRPLFLCYPHPPPYNPQIIIEPTSFETRWHTSHLKRVQRVSLDLLITHIFTVIAATSMRFTSHRLKIWPFSRFLFLIM